MEKGFLWGVWYYPSFHRIILCNSYHVLFAQVHLSYNQFELVLVLTEWILTYIPLNLISSPRLQPNKLYQVCVPGQKNIKIPNNLQVIFFCQASQPDFQPNSPSAFRISNMTYHTIPLCDDDVVHHLGSCPGAAHSVMCSRPISATTSLIANAEMRIV